MTLSKQGIVPKTETQDFRIFVGGLTPSTTNQMLMDYFSKFGEITSSEVVYDGNQSKFYIF